MVSSFSMDRVPLDDSDFIIEPRPVTVLIPSPKPLQTSIKGTVEQDGPTRDEILLTALTIVARKEPQTVATRGAMRDLIRRHSVECGLGF
jgi:hypothetical protein